MDRLTAVRTAVTAASLMVAGAGTLRAQRNVDTTFAVRGPVRLSVTNQNGNINVRGWNRPQIRIQTESEERGRGIEIREGAGRIEIRTNNRYGGGETDFTINVPIGTAVETRSLSSDVGISGVCGEVQINGTSGDIDVDCVEGNASIETISGDLTINNVKGSLDVSSTSGDVDVRGVKGPSVNAHSVSGDVSLSAVESPDVSATTVSGGVEYQGRIADNGRYQLEAHSGDVSLHVSGTFNATVTVYTFSGDFETDVPIEIQPGHQMGREWQFKQGNGSARIQLKSFSGSINLHRGSSASPREE